MTEKLWEIIGEEFISYNGGYAILIGNEDCQFHIWETRKDAQKVYDKLNELNDENEQLKSRVDYLERKIQRERNSFRKTQERWSKEAEDKIKELLEENKQLKQTIKRLNSNIDELLTVDVEEDLLKENKELRYHLNRVEKELKEYKNFMSLG